MAKIEERSSRIHGKMLGMLVSDGEMHTSNRINTTYLHLEMKVGSHLYGFHQEITQGNEETRCNHGSCGQT